MEQGPPAAVALLARLSLALASLLVACAPADLGGSSGLPDGAPGERDAAPGEDADPPPGSPCDELGVRRLSDFEVRFIGPRCGSAGCHQRDFAPRNLDVPGMVRSALVGVKSQVLCKADQYVNKADPTRSFVLAKVNAMTDDVQCPSGGAPDSGGVRMPTRADQPTMVAPRLTDAELYCFTWYINAIAEQ